MEGRLCRLHGLALTKYQGAGNNRRVGCHSPTINEMYFPQTASAGYWSASTSAVDDTRAWGVVFLHGVNMQILKNSVGTIRLVRDSL
ncbi:DUF1566 domain-containing protein [Candidatus Reidiella endopervernicosa]|uniref:DUF1566 domain-containing protein n=1 Tax=Candidatus Reidiella endopervernicosa TaxID=2738883 RepID=UPI003B967904